MNFNIDILLNEIYYFMVMKSEKLYIKVKQNTSNSLILS